jgi:hypothetical protein
MYTYDMRQAEVIGAWSNRTGSQRLELVRFVYEGWPESDKLNGRDTYLVRETLKNKLQPGWGYPVSFTRAEVIADFQSRLKQYPNLKREATNWQVKGR